MDCEEFARLLDNYENLTIEEKIALCKHSAVCEKCRAELDFSRAVTDAVHTLPRIEAPSDFMQKLNSRIDAEERISNKNRIIKHLYANRQKYSTMAACLLLVAVVGFNGKSLVDKMNGTDDGVIYETSSSGYPTDSGTDAVPSSAPSAASLSGDSASGSNAVSSDNAASEKGSTPAASSPIKSEPVSSDSGNTESATGGTPSSERTRNTSSVSSHETSSAGSGNTYGTRESNNTSYGSSGSSSYGTSASESTYTASEYSSETAAEPTAQAAESGSEETVASPDANSTSSEETEGVSIPRERYVMSQDDDAENDVYADASEAYYEDTGYSIADSDSNTTVAAANTEGSPIPDQNSLVLDGLLLIREADYDAACGIIDSYISSVYGSCYMITPDNLSKLCNTMQNEGIEFENSISAERSQVTFRVIKY